MDAVSAAHFYRNSIEVERILLGGKERKIEMTFGWKIAVEPEERK